MNLRATLAAFSVLLSVPAARASSDRPPSLFDIPQGSVDKQAQEKIATVEKTCRVSMYSRIGPSPAQRARCEAAVVAALESPKAAARAALFRLDQIATSSGSALADPESTPPWRLYDVVARAQDLSLLETLVVALERIEAGGLASPRAHERHQIAGTLKRLTYAEPKGTPAIAWRAWLREHPTVTRDELLAAHVTALRAVLRSPTSEGEEQFAAIEFLINQPTTRSEGLQLVAGIAARTKLSPAQRDRLQRLAKSYEAAKPSGDPTAVLGPRS